MFSDNLKKPFISGYLVFVLVIAGFIGFFTFEGIVNEGNVQAATIIVDAGGNGDYTMIQDAIDNANSGDTIRVWAGSYFENVIVNKTVTLIGNGTINTTIDGGKKDDVVRVTANWVNVTGFTITNSDFVTNDAGIELANVQNCSLYNNNVSSNNGYGIFLQSSSNNIVMNNSCINNRGDGIRLWFSSSNNIIMNNTCISNYKNGIYLYGNWAPCNSNTLRNNICKSNLNHGIYLYESNINTILNNTCSNNSYDGILLSFSSNNLLKNNSMVSCGLFIEGNKLEQWNTHIIDNNSVNGKPIIYWKNKNGGTIPNGVGEVILANSQNIVVENQNVSHGSCGIILGFSSDNIVKNNTCSNNYHHGISLYNPPISGNSNTLMNNTCSNNSGHGISLTNSRYNKFIANKCLNNTGNGINLESSSRNTLLNNTCLNNNKGIDIGDTYDILRNNTCSNNSIGILVDGKYHTISNNSCNSNNFYGIHLDESSSNILNNNNCSLNKDHGIFLYGEYSTCISNTLMYNNCLKNGKYGIWLFKSSDNTLVNNKCWNNSEGIKLGSSKNNLLINNTCNSNNDSGIGMDYSSNTNKLMNNTCSNNDNGIYLMGKSSLGINNILSSNLILKNNIGIDLDSSTNNNLLYHNIIISNTQQAIDIGNNYWNNSRLEGNYWSDYSGVDDGSNSRIKGDGIGDTDLPHLGLDNYPFVRPSGWLFPTKPTLNAVNNIVTDGNFTLSWNPTKRTIGYNLEEDTNFTFSSPIIIFNGSELSFNIKNKSNGTYYYRVRSYNNDHESAWSNIENITVDWSPQIPTGLIVENVTGLDVILSWTPNQEPDIIEYRIFMNDSDSGLGGPFHLIQSVNYDINRSIITGLIEETTYHFVITACDKYSNSSYSDPVSVTTLDVTSPAKPKLFEAEAINDTQIKLTWSLNSEADLMGYKVYMNSTKQGIKTDFEPLITVEPSVISIIITGLTEQNTYFFKLKAFDEAPNYSIFSDIAFATTPDTNAPTKPTGLAISNPNYDSLTLSWSPNPETDITKYLIFRGTSEHGTFGIINSALPGDNKYIDSGLEENAVYYYKLQAMDDAEHYSPYSDIVFGKTLQPPYPPEINNSIADFELKEDTRDELSINLYYWFRDPNNDRLMFGVEGEKHLEVTIFQENGTVILMPEKNWNGQETLTFYANDSIFEISETITITVTPLNDPPVQPKILMPEQDSGFTVNDLINFSGTCADPDLIYGDGLTFKWSSNIDGQLGNGENLTGIKLSKGAHKITLEVSDTKGAKASTSINIIVAGIPDDNGKNGDDDGDGIYAFDIVGIAIVIIIIIIIIILVVIFFIFKRKQLPKPGEDGESLPETISTEGLQTQDQEPIQRSEPGQPIIDQPNFPTEQQMQTHELTDQSQQDISPYYQQQTTQTPIQQPLQTLETEDSFNEARDQN